MVGDRNRPLDLLLERKIIIIIIIVIMVKHFHYSPGQALRGSRRLRLADFKAVGT
jgi:hypothetical protein